MSALLSFISVSGLVDLAIKSAVVMLLAVVAAALLGRASAAWRHLVWCLGVVSLLLLPVLSLALPAWQVAWLPRWSAEPPQVATAGPTTETQSNHLEPAVAAPLDDQPPATNDLPPSVAALESASHEPLPVAGETTDHTERSLSLSENTSTLGANSDDVSSPSRSVVPWWAIGWAVGALLALVPLAVGLVQLTALHRRSRVIDDRCWLNLLDQLRRQLTVRRGVELRQSEAALAPLTWGALRPVLLVPAEAGAWPDERRRLVLLHELAHVRRWDWLTQLVAHVACALYWFNPLVWLAARQMRIERERACDDLVLAAGARPSDYAQELLALAAGLSHSRLSALVAVPMARRGVLEDRLRGILDTRRSRAALTTAAVCLGAALAAAATLPLAMLRAAPLQPPAALSAGAQQSPPVKVEPAPEKRVEKPAAKTVTIRGKVVDDGTMEPIAQFKTQAGKFNADLKKFIWGWRAEQFSKGDGAFSTTVGGEEGWTARIVAAGYFPQPVLASAPPADKDEVEVTIRLKRVPEKVRGVVLDHAGKPLAAAAIFAVGPAGVNLVVGEARFTDPQGSKNDWVRPVHTDERGRFELAPEGNTTLAVSHAEFDAWAAAIPPSGDMLVRLPRPARVEVNLDIAGADKESVIFYQFLSHLLGEEFTGVTSSRYVPIANPGKLTLAALPPGKYQLARHGGVMLDRQIFEVKSGETKTFDFVRGKGAMVRGKVTWPKDARLMGVVVSVLSESSEVLASTSPGDGGNFLTERIPPGTHQVIAYAFAEQTPERLLNTSPIPPSYEAQVKIVVPADGEVKADELVLKPIPGRVRKEAPPVKEKPAEEKPAEKPAVKPASPPIEIVNVRGKVLDDATGEPIGGFTLQGGKFDPAEPGKVTWGYWQRSFNARETSFTTSVRWPEGWTARVVADGYLPQPVLASAPPAGKDDIEVTIRLKRGPTIRGVVLDHAGKPLVDAAVFPVVEGAVLNLAGGQAWSRAPDYGPDGSVRPARTDAEGRFELAAGGAKSLAVSHARFDAWPAAIPEKGEVTIRLPEPARVEVNLDIDGADKESVIFYQLLSNHMPGFGLLQSSRWVKIANPGKLSLNSLPPGKYQLCRRPGKILEQQLFEIAAGEKKTFDFVRNKGARVRGKVTWPADAKIASVHVTVQGETVNKSPFDKFEWNTVYALANPGEDGAFLTERIPPGTYQLVAYAFRPLTEKQQFRTGATAPSYHAQLKIEVPAEGELKVDNLALQSLYPEETKAAPPAKEKPAADKPVDKPAEKPAAAAPQKDPLLGKEAAERVKKFRPSFSKEQKGVEVGIAIASDRKTFHLAERVPLEFVIRNVSQKTLHVEHGLYPPETPPTVKGADGKQLSIEPIYLFGAIRLYRDILKPNEVAVYRHMGLGLGEKPEPPGTFWHPFLKGAAPGKCRLSQEVHLTVREEGDDSGGTSFRAVSGEVEFEIALADPKKGVGKPEETPVEKPAEKAEKPVGKALEDWGKRQVTVRGKVVDDATMEPIAAFIINEGKIDPANPKSVIWGGRVGPAGITDVPSKGTDGSFSTIVGGAEGSTARILADGYFPQPLLAAAVPADKDELEVTVRLVRVPKRIRGVVLDHAAKPLKDAAVFAVGPQTGLNLVGGEARPLSLSSLPLEHSPPHVRTDAEGRFELATEGARSVAVSHVRFDRWHAVIPKRGDMTIRLPEPARLEIKLDIEGAEKESVVMYQFLSHLSHDMASGVVVSTRSVSISNPGKLTLAAMSPGKYQYWRGSGRMQDREFFELTPGQVKRIEHVRKAGARVRGKIVWPAGSGVSGAHLVITSNDEAARVYASAQTGEDGTFLTERVPPGSLHLAAYVYQLSIEDASRYGFPVPTHWAQVTIEVPMDGEVKIPDVVLKSRRPAK